MIAVAATASLHAQISKGTMMLGGNMGISTSGGTTKVGGTSTDLPKTTELSFNPAFGYFIMDNVSVGLGLGLNSMKTTTTTLTTETTTTTKLNGVFVFGRYYKMFTDNFGLFGQLQLGPVFGKTTTEAKDLGSGVTVTTENKISGFGASINPALVFFPTSRIGLEASFANLSFNSIKTTDDASPSTETKENNFDLSVNTMINFGFFWYFNR